MRVTILSIKCYHDKLRVRLGMVLCPDPVCAMSRYGGFLPKHVVGIKPPLPPVTNSCVLIAPVLSFVAKRRREVVVCRTRAFSAGRVDTSAMSSCWSSFETCLRKIVDVPTIRPAPRFCVVEGQWERREHPHMREEMQ